MVAPKGFEPSTSALRGRRPKPLDDGATCDALLHSIRLPIKRQVAGVAGVEPTHMAPETTVLPLDDTPTCSLSSQSVLQTRESILPIQKRSVKEKFRICERFLTARNKRGKSPDKAAALPARTLLQATRKHRCQSARSKDPANSDSSNRRRQARTSFPE